MSIHSESYSPEHMRSEKERWTQWVIGTIALGIISFCLIFALSPLVYWAAEHSFNQQSWAVTSDYLQKIGQPDFIGQAHTSLWQHHWLSGATVAGGSFLAALFIAAIFFALCPYSSFEKTHGDVRWAVDKDIRRMEARRQIGVKGGYVGILGKWKDGSYIRLIEPISVACSAPPGTGKCLGLDVPVLMYDGTIKKNGDLRVGDLLMGPDSKPRTVLAANRGYGPMYRVTPTKGDPFTCNGDHILSLRRSKTPRHRAINPKRGTLEFVSVDEWLKWGNNKKFSYKGWRAPVEFKAAAEPPVDPYFLGVLIGDGTMKGKIGVQTADAEILDVVMDQAAHYGLKVRDEYQDNNASGAFFLTAGNGPGSGPDRNPLMNQITKLGLRVSGSDKHIPHLYKTASRRDRLALLAGIIDTDGSYDPSGKGYDLVTVSKRLADDIAFVARSLGFAAYPRPCKKTCTNTSAVGDYYRVYISGHISEIPVKLYRRQAKPRIAKNEVTNFGFEIEPIGQGEWHGIVLDGDHQFLLGDFTVTHNTAALVVPSIVESPTISMIVNDPKPELADMTSGYRAEIGNVFIIDWSATDKPQEGIFYPRFNFLASQLVPPPNTAERDTYLDAVAKVLIPDSKSGDKYFTDKGRDCLTGFMHYLVSHVNDAKSDEGIPNQWKGMEASFPMLVDWIADAQFQAGKRAEAANAQAAANKELPTADGMKMFLSGLADHIKAGDYSERAFTSLAPLIDMADKERSGVLGTMDQALLPFKNKAVKERTSACDFTPADLRGMRDIDTGEWLPVTLYICVNQAEAQAFANITALLYEVLSREFLSFGPSEFDKRGRQMGPLTICFMMDEFAKLPKSETVLTGPDLGRSKKVSYWLIFQARSQIIKTYSKEDGTTIDSTCGVTVLLSQNDPETAAHYQKTVGKTTVRKQSYSRNAGLSKSANPWARNESIASEGVDFLRIEDITAMEPGTHLILPQNFLNRPMKVKSPFFFEDEAMLANVFNPRTGKGPAPANPLPEHLRLKRCEEWIEKLTKQQEIESAEQEKGLAQVALAGVQQNDL